MMDLEHAGDALTWASSYLNLTAVRNSLPDTDADARIAVLRQEAETLLLWATDWTRVQLHTSLSEPLPSSVQEAFYRAVIQRSQDMPLQYITGVAPFYGRMFDVRPGCLIPRPETEYLVEAAIGWIQQQRPDARVLDIGSGSGVIAISIALACPMAEVSSVDISQEALDIANANKRKFGAKVTFSLQDGHSLLAALAQGDGSQKPTVIVSNPPYIPSADVATLDAEVVDHEPALALDGGRDGLDYYRAFAAIGDRGFTESGPAAIFLEVGYNQADSVLSLFTQGQADSWHDWTFDTLHDLQRIRRIVYGSRADSLRA